MHFVHRNMSLTSSGRKLMSYGRRLSVEPMAMMVGKVIRGLLACSIQRLSALIHHADEPAWQSPTIGKQARHLLGPYAKERLVLLTTTNRANMEHIRRSHPVGENLHLLLNGHALCRMHLSVSRAVRFCSGRMQKPKPVPVVVVNCPVLTPWRGCVAFPVCAACLCGVFVLTTSNYPLRHVHCHFSLPSQTHFGSPRPYTTRQNLALQIVIGRLLR